MANPPDDALKIQTVGDSVDAAAESNLNEQTIDYRDDKPAEQESAALPEKYGRYLVRQLLGRGGLGEVYLGFDPQLDRQVAIKVPRIRDLKAQQNLAKEARQVAQFSHPGIVAVYDVGEENGQFYIVSEFLQGTSLEKWLKSNQPTWQDAVRIVADVADALGYAHSRRTIHRDVKPDNIVLKENLVPVLIDFGLAINDATATEEQIGLIAGTFQYMSPEQADGKGHRIDGRTDIYALGVVLYRMLVGRTPFQSSDRQELLRQVREDSPQPPRQLLPGLPTRVEQICLKAMEKQPEHRFSTAGDMAQALRGCISGTPSDVARAAKAPPTRRVRSAERRQLTILHCRCELFESDEFLNSSDPEDQHEFLAAYQQICERAIEKYGGTVVQSAGHELLICCGYPVSFEDAAHRAVRIAIALRDGVRGIAATFEARFRRKIGVTVGAHTGPAIAEELAENKSTERLSLTGEARTVATHLHAVSPSNMIVVTQATYHLVRGYFTVTSLGVHSVKGISQPIELFQVLNEAEARNRIDFIDSGSLSPLIGRDLEVNVVKDRWEKAREGLGQVLLLSGDPGLGKSRLVRELREHVEQTDSVAPMSNSSKTSGLPGSVVEWRCSPYYQNTDFYPAIDAFERLLGFTSGDQPSQRLERLTAHLNQFHLSNPQASQLFAALLSLPPDPSAGPLDFSPQRLKELIQECLAEWLQACADRHPLLLIIEDLHWIDPTTLEFLRHLSDQAASTAILVVLTFRPEFDSPFRGKANQTELALNKLNRRQVAEMLERRTGLSKLPDGLIERILARTEGVPLFIEEFIQVLLESRSLQKTGGQVELVQSFELDAIPSTLQDLLMARLDRMDSLPEITQMAAVLGREFSYEWLAATTEIGDEELKTELTKLVKAGILFQKGKPPRSSYTFKHALLQDAAYQSLLRKKRQQFHGRFAAALETRFSDRVESAPELLAHHWTEAGDYTKGVTYWRKAGLRAQTRSANQEAIVHFKKGLAILEAHLGESRERDELELGLQAPLGVVLTAVRGWGSPEVGPTIERARALCEQVGSITDRFFALWGLWGFRLLRLELDQCRMLADEVMGLLAGSAEGAELLGEAHWIPGCTAFYAGDFATALYHFESGWKLYDAPRAQANSLRTGQNVGVLYQAHIAVILWETGFPDKALVQAEEVVRFAKELGHPFSLAMALYYRRRVYQCCGFEEKVRESVDEELALCQQQGFAFWQAHALFARAQMLIQQKYFADAEALLTPLVQAVDASGCKCSLSHPYAFLAEAYVSSGQPEAATKWIGRGLALVEEHHERCLESELLRLKGDLLLLAPTEGESPEKYFELAIASGRLRDAKSRELRGAISLARVLHTHQRNAEAHVLLTGILSTFTEGFATHDLREASELLTSTA
jgi:class 3 adenylate cyclase/tetratricopeptide (TPR) repeat protein